MNASCLCGKVELKIGAFTGPFELCHCRKCRKHTGSAFNAVIDSVASEFKVLRGQHLYKSYIAPLQDTPPNYQVWFCSNCGSPLPDPTPKGDAVEVPVGLINSAICTTPDKNVFTEHMLPWISGIADLKGFTKDQYAAYQRKYGRKRIE